jgi:hypothetical protein
MLARVLGMNSSSARRRPPRQQEIEQHYFEMFRKVYPLPDGAISYGYRPDVTLTGARTIGIEITNFYLNDGSSAGSEQVQRKRRESVISMAQSLYAESGGLNIALTFSFDADAPIGDIGGVAKKIAALARVIQGQDNGTVRRDAFRHIPELDFVYFHARELQYSDEPDPQFPNGQPDVSEGFSRFREYSNRREARARRAGIYKPLSFTAKWKLGQGHRFGLTPLNRLNDIIREKEKKARRYATCDAYWLLVVVEFIDAAQEQEIHVDGVTFTSDVFEKIILYKTGFEQMVEVAVRPVGAS